jgi:tetratricopeptide (TPR) repeat protein
MQKFLPLVAAVLFAATSAVADDLQDASRLLKSGQAQQALETVNKALAAKPRDPQARFLKGLILTEQGNSREAIDIFTRLTQDYPDLPEPYNNLAVIYASQGEYDKARVALEKSIRTHPSYATAYENLGDVYAKLASQAYGKALQLDASNTGAKNKLSLVRELVGSPAAAEAAKPPVVAAVAPKPVPEKPKAESPDASADILGVVNAWAAAWSKKDVDAYLSHYAKDFRTPGNESRASWEKARRTRINAPKSIEVAVASPRVTVQGAEQATVRFRQSYRSDVLQTNSAKTLVMVKSDGRWLIREEKSGN